MPQSKRTGGKRVTKKKNTKKRRKIKKKVVKKKNVLREVVKKKTRNKKSLHRTKRKNQKKKVVKKKIYKKVIHKSSENENENIDEIYKLLVTKIRRAKKPENVNKFFNKILELINPKIRRIVSKFHIPGFDQNDIYQEALFALRYKAIKDYDYTRGIDTDIAPFDRFAILCIRRHLATEYKVSFQNKKRILNSSISLNQDSNGKDKDLSLINILPSDSDDVLDILEDKEKFSSIIKKLYISLSILEKEVFALYAHKYSYEEIAYKINHSSSDSSVDIKSVDNALSRIKNKARSLIPDYPNI